MMSIRTLSACIGIIAATLLFVPGQADAATLAKPSNNLGLVGYWSFEDAAGTKATDFSGNGNTGTLTNGPTWGSGKRGSAISFDGTNDYVDAGAGTSLDFGTGNFTAGAWVKTVSAARRTIINKFQYDGTGASEQGFYIDMLANGTIRAAIESDGGDKYRIIDSSVSVNDGRWHHVALVRSAQNTIDLYIDGVLRSTGSQTAGTVTTINTANSLKIGFESDQGNGSGFSSYWNGQIDEVRMYSRALSATEIGALYGSGAGKFAQGPSRTGLLGYWSFEDATGTKATDFSGVRNHATLNNFSAPATASSGWGNGARGKALTFDGTNDYVEAGIDTYTDAQVGSAGTVSSWFKLNALPSNGSSYVIFDIEGWLGDQVTTTGGNTRIQGRFYGSVSAVGTTNLRTGVWYHYTATWGPAGIRIYLNGVEEATSTYSSNISPNSFNRSNNIGNPCNACSQYYFNGSIDEVMLYGRQLSAAEVKSLYGAGSNIINVSQNRTGSSLDSGLVGMWSFNGPDTVGTTTYDRSGNGNHGTLTNGPVRAIGKVGQALSFDGSNDYVATNFTQQLGDFTACAWFKASATGAANIAVARIMDKNYATGFWIGKNSSGEASSWGGGVLNTNSPYGIYVTLQDGQWNHICSIRSGTTHTIIGNGGAVTNSQTVSGTALDSSALVMGYIDPRPFSGQIDEVRIYNRALSTSEVRQLYNLGK